MEIKNRKTNLIGVKRRSGTGNREVVLGRIWQNEGP